MLHANSNKITVNESLLAMKCRANWFINVLYCDNVHFNRSRLMNAMKLMSCEKILYRQLFSVRIFFRNCRHGVRKPRVMFEFFCIFHSLGRPVQWCNSIIHTGANFLPRQTLDNDRPPCVCSIKYQYR